MKGNEDEWGPRVEPYTQEENDAEMEAVKSAGNADSARKMYDEQDRIKKIANEAINTLHATPGDLQTQEDRDIWARSVANTAAKKYGISDTDPDYYAIYNAAKNILFDIYQKDLFKKEEAGNQFAKPRQPMSVDKINNRVNKDRFNVNKFVDNVRDNLLGM